MRHSPNLISVGDSVRFGGESGVVVQAHPYVAVRLYPVPGVINYTRTIWHDQLHQLEIVEDDGGQA